MQAECAKQVEALKEGLARELRKQKVRTAVSGWGSYWYRPVLMSQEACIWQASKPVRSLIDACGKVVPCWLHFA
jgi:hypothetical protein